MMKNMTMNNKNNAAMNNPGISMEDTAELLAMIASLSTMILNLPVNRGSKMLTDAAFDCIDEIDKIIERNDIPVAVMFACEENDDENDESAKEEKSDEPTPSELADVIVSNLTETMFAINELYRCVIKRDYRSTELFKLDEAIEALKNILEREAARNEK